MKKYLFLLLFIFVLIGYNEVTRFNREVSASIQVTNEVVQACTIDMQKDKNIICD